MNEAPRDIHVLDFAWAELARAQAELEAPREERTHSISYWLGVIATAHKLLALKPEDSPMEARDRIKRAW